MRLLASAFASVLLLVASVQPGLAQVVSHRLSAGSAASISGASLDATFDGTPSLPSLELGASPAPLSSLSSLSEGRAVPVALAPRGLASAPEAKPTVSRWQKLFTGLRIAAVAPLIAATLPMGRLEVYLRSRDMLKKYPGSKTLGGGHSNVVLLAKDASGERRIVKRYGVTGTLLAMLSRFVLPTPNPGGMGRRHRFEADKAAFQDFESAGIPASRILETDPRTLTNVSSFVDGRPLMALVKDDVAMAESARSLRLAHDRGWAIIDNQPSNFVVGSDGRAYFIDLEHAYRDPQGRYRAWDIGVYLAWLDAGLDEAAARKAEAAFWAGYGPISSELGDEVSVVRQQLEILRPFMKISFDDSASGSVPPPKQEDAA
jgi:tRNA A-37 threonylcarbamoyl transferase component Bud32